MTGPVVPATELTDGRVIDRPAPPTPPAPSARLARLLHPLGWYLGTRLLVLAVAALAIAVRPGLTASRLVSAWDAGWYLTLVKHGYPTIVPEVAGHAAKTPLAFFPLFPFLARVLTWLLRVPNAVATTGVSLMFGAVATVAVARLAARLTDEQRARRATVLFCLFPGSVVFSLGYSESLMIALAAGCLLALLDGRWWLAGVTAALATATRPNAVGLVAACAVASAAAIYSRREWRSLVAPLLAPVGILGFLAYLGRHTGESGVWFRVQREGWHQEFDFGVNTGKTIWNFIVDPFGDPHQIAVMVLLGFTLACTAVFLSMRRGWGWPVTVYTLSVIVLATASTIDIVRPRAIVTAFPLFIGLGATTSRRGYAALCGVFAAGLVLLVFFPFWASP